MSDFSCGNLGIRRDFTIKIGQDCWDFFENTMGGYDSAPYDYDQVYLGVKAASGVNLYARLNAARAEITYAACGR